MENENENEELEKPEVEEQQPELEQEQSDKEEEFDAKETETGETVIQRRPNRKERLREEASRRTQETVERVFSSKMEPTLREIAEIKRLLSQRLGQQQPAPTTQHELQQSEGDEYERLSNSQELILQAMRSDGADVAGLTKKYNELERKKTLALIKMNSSEQQPRHQQPQVDPQMAILEAEYGDVVGHQDAFAWSVSTARARTAFNKANGKGPLSLDEQRAILIDAAHKFGIRKPAPSKASITDKQKLSGTSASPGSVSSNGEIKLTKQQMSLAVEAFPGVSPAVAAGKWWKMMKEEGIL